MKLILEDLVIEFLEMLVKIFTWQEVNFNGWIPTLQSFAEVSTWNSIMEDVENLKSNDKNKIYTIYCDHDGDTVPEYGLEYISSDMDINENVVDDQYSYTVNGTDGLNDALTKIIGENLSSGDQELTSVNGGQITIPAEYNINTVEVVVTDSDNNTVGTYTIGDGTGVISVLERKVYLNKISDLAGKTVTIKAEI